MILLPISEEKRLSSFVITIPNRKIEKITYNGPNKDMRFTMYVAGKSNVNDYILSGDSLVHRIAIKKLSFRLLELL